MKKFIPVLISLLLVIGLVATSCSTTPAASEGAESQAPASSQAAVESASSEDQASGEKFEIVMIAKTEGLAWFDAMKEGVKAFNDEHSDEVNAYQHSPEGADAAKQAAMVEDYIAKGVDAICIVPNDPESLMPVVKKAREAGIVVVIHEGAALKNTANYDLEVIDNIKAGALMGQKLGEAMGGKGKYCAVVGGLTMQTHMEWFKGATDYIKENYPDMVLINEQPFEDGDDAKVGYDLAKQAIKANPDMTGYLALTVESCSSMARVLKETNNQNIKVAGLALPEACGEYIKDGWIQGGVGNSPIDAGYATVNLAYKILKGEEIGATVDLGKPGLEKCTVTDGLVQGEAVILFTPENLDQYKGF